MAALGARWSLHRPAGLLDLASLWLLSACPDTALTSFCSPTRGQQLWGGGAASQPHFQYQGDATRCLYHFRTLLFRFMENLQTEVQEMEFLQFSKGLNFMRKEDFAEWLLFFTNTENKDIYWKNVREKLSVGEVGMPFLYTFERHETDQKFHRT